MGSSLICSPSASLYKFRQIQVLLRLHLGLERFDRKKEFGKLTFFSYVRFRENQKEKNMEEN